MKWNSDVKAYIEFFQNGCPKHIRPLRCLDCGFDGLLHRHDHYVREVVTLSAAYSITMYRFKCPACGETQTLRPNFIGPNRQSTWDVEESIIEANESGTPLAELAEDFPPPAGPYSEKTFWRWKITWNLRLAKIHTLISQQILDKLPNMAIPVGKDKPHSTKDWLLYFWRKWRIAFPAQEFIGFFHWLYRICRSANIPFCSIKDVANPT